MSALGADISCMADLDPTFALVEGEVQLGQALVRRLLTRRGTLIRAASYGRDLAALLNGRAPGASAVAAWIKTEFEADERVLRATVTAAWTPTSGTLAARATVQTRTGTTFRLSLAVSAVTVALLSIDRV